MGILVLRGVGWVPQKSADFGATAPAQSSPDPVAAPKNIPFGTIFIKFGDTKTCCTFSLLELAPKNRKKIIGALSCMHKGPKYIQSLWDHPKKIPFVQKNKEGARCTIVREKPNLGAFPEAKKANWRSQPHAQRSKMHSTPLGPSQKNSFVQNNKEGAICVILREKPHFGAFPEAKKGVLKCARLRRGPIIMQIPRGYQKKKFIV